MMPGGNIFVLATILAFLSDYLSSSFFCNIILAPILFHVANMLWATVLAFLAGFLILVAKIKFVRKVLAAKVDVNIFNHTLALCLIASGNKRKKRDFQLLSGVATMLFLPLTVWLLGNNYGEVANQKFSVKLLSEIFQILSENWESKDFCPGRAVRGQALPLLTSLHGNCNHNDKRHRQNYDTRHCLPSI